LDFACDAIGMFIASNIGGRLFDVWSPTGPFVLFGCFALLVSLCGIGLGLWGMLRYLATSLPRYLATSLS
jgi:hypothetical protein